MPNEPVQVVLNPGALRAPRDRVTPNGNGTDFFASRPQAFAKHQTEVAAALKSILSAIEKNPDSGALGYIRVAMAPNAIAKSHRPQQRLFRPSLTPHVATAGIGEPKEPNGWLGQELDTATFSSCSPSLQLPQILNLHPSKQPRSDPLSGN